ncbi:F-box associated domain containing protein [Tanacetum coccineum]
MLTRISTTRKDKTRVTRKAPTLTTLLRDKKVLVVEDNVINTRVAEGALKKYGAIVTCVDNEKAALDKLRQPHCFDPSFTVRQMAEMDGVWNRLTKKRSLGYTSHVPNEERAICKLTTQKLEGVINDVKRQAYFVFDASSTAKLVFMESRGIHFVLLISRQGKVRLTKWYSPYTQKERSKVCELDLIFNFHKAYYILDEVLIAGELQESSKKTVARLVAAQDSLVEVAKEEANSISNIIAQATKALLLIKVSDFSRLFSLCSSRSNGTASIEFIGEDNFGPWIGTRFLLLFSNFWRRHGFTFSCSVASEKSSITIPQDIITEILYYLPTKSAGRFRCVSKQWLSLLSEPQFIKTHHQKMRNRNCFILWSYDSSHYSVPFNYRKAVSRLAKLPVESRVVDRDCVEFLGSCNGLIVLASLRELRWFGKFVIVNLITRDYVELLMFRHEWSDIMKHDSMILGFGYDSVTDDYKVVSIYSYRYFAPPYKSFVYVYSHRSNTWRRLGDQAYYSSTEEGISDIMFDINSKLVALGEKLAIFHAVKGVVWLMNEYGVKESWTKIVVHGFNEIPMNKPEIFYDNRKLLFVWRNIMWTYDLEEGTFCETADIFDMHLWRVKCAYVESLVKSADTITDRQLQANNINA